MLKQRCSRICAVSENKDTDYILSDSDKRDMGEESDSETYVRNVLQSRVAPRALPRDSFPLYCPPTLQFTAKLEMIMTVQDSGSVMAFIDIFFAEECFQHVADQTNLYAAQAIDAAPCPFTKYSLYHNWVTVYTSSQQLALDEGMLAWRRRLQFRIYNPGKIVKYGIIVRMVCGSSSDMQIIDLNETGRDSSRVTTVIPRVSSIHGQLLQQYQIIKQSSCKANLNMWYIQNRGLPKGFKQQSSSLQRGEMTFTREGPVLLIAWRDKRYTLFNSFVLLCKSNPSKLTFLQYMQSVSRHLIQLGQQSQHGGAFLMELVSPDMESTLLGTASAR
ncbi:hypothetical protein PR048_001343 [Dryococelus australis]|uniref:PiggyBac transposable element-derived protein domain-containing protein n=1 Tax=Dryococelus australis TaxID=614101 RepID=A0ABQ9IHT0_9NEOP|nr:hypothetical protein PR048_001343 [Dryococelus australis]